MRMRRSITLLVTIALVGGWAAAVRATPPSGVASTVLGKGGFDEIDASAKAGKWKAEVEANRATDVQFTEHRLSPGGWMGWHSHPGPSVVVVKAGSITYYLASGSSCPSRTYVAGQGFVDPGGPVHTVRNEGTTETVLLVASLIPSGKPGRIDQPKPAECAF